MRYLIVLLLAGCASKPDYDASKYEPVCAQRCLASHSICAGGAQGAVVISNNILAQCNEIARQCLSTCPAK